MMNAVPEGKPSLNSRTPPCSFHRRNYGDTEGINAHPQVNGANTGQSKLGCPPYTRAPKPSTSSCPVPRIRPNRCSWRRTSAARPSFCCRSLTWTWFWMPRSVFRVRSLLACLNVLAPSRASRQSRQTFHQSRSPCLVPCRCPASSRKPGRKQPAAYYRGSA